MPVLKRSVNAHAADTESPCDSGWTMTSRPHIAYLLDRQGWLAAPGDLSLFRRFDADSLALQQEVALDLRYHCEHGQKNRTRRVLRGEEQLQHGQGRTTLLQVVNDV